METECPHPELFLLVGLKNSRNALCFELRISSYTKIYESLGLPSYQYVFPPHKLNSGLGETSNENRKKKQNKRQPKE